jgi:hypothetical protein
MGLAHCSHRRLPGNRRRRGGRGLRCAAIERAAQSRAGRSGSRTLKFQGTSWPAQKNLKIRERNMR